jgi:hypothetical protein
VGKGTEKQAENNDFIKNNDIFGVIICFSPSKVISLQTKNIFIVNH